MRQVWQRGLQTGKVVLTRPFLRIRSVPPLAYLPHGRDRLLHTFICSFRTGDGNRRSRSSREDRCRQYTRRWLSTRHRDRPNRTLRTYSTHTDSREKHFLPCKGQRLKILRQTKAVLHKDTFKRTGQTGAICASTIPVRNGKFITYQKISVFLAWTSRH